MLITDSIWSLQENIIYDARGEKVHFVSRESQCFPRLPQSSDDLLYSWKFWSWKFIKPRCNGTRRSTFAGNSALLPSNIIEFCNVTGWEILAGNSFIGTCHVTLKRPMRAQAVGKRIAFPTKSSEWTTLKRGNSAPANANCSSLLAEIYFHKKNLYS